MGKDIVVGLVILLIAAFIGQYLYDNLYKPWRVNSKTAYELCSEARNIYEYKGKYQEAIDAYTKAIKKDPKYSDAYFGRGDIYYYRLRDKEKALADYYTAASLGDNAAKLYVDSIMAEKQAATDSWRATMKEWNDRETIRQIVRDELARDRALSH